MFFTGQVTQTFSHSVLIDAGEFNVLVQTNIPFFQGQFVFGIVDPFHVNNIRKGYVVISWCAAYTIMAFTYILCAFYSHFASARMEPSS